MLAVILAIYGLGVLIGLAATDARWPARAGLALCWPLGPAAFVLVISGLTLVAVGLWPLVMIPLLAALGLLIRLLT